MASYKKFDIKSAFKAATPKLVCLGDASSNICDDVSLKATEINKIRISPKSNSEQEHSVVQDSVCASSGLTDSLMISDNSSELLEEQFLEPKVNRAPFHGSLNSETVPEEYAGIPPEGETSLKQHIQEGNYVNVMEHSEKYPESEPVTVDSFPINKAAIEDSIETECLSILKLANKYLKEEPPARIHQDDDLSVILKTFPDTMLQQDHMLCFSILLCVISRFPSNESRKKIIESHLIKLLQATKSKKKADGTTPSNEIGGHEIRMLPEVIQDKATAICKELKICDDWELSSVDLCFVACTSLKNLFVNPSGGFKQHGCNPDILHCVLEKIHEAVQLLALTKPVCVTESANDYHLNLRVICKCLQVLEQASFMNPDNKKYILGCQNFVLSRHSNRLLGFCLKSLFYDDALPQTSQQQSQENQSPEINELHFYLKSCLVCVLKVLLNITHDCKEAVIKLGTIEGLMEKLLMCTLNVCSKSSEEQFEVLILCLELIINLIEPSWSNRKVFAVLCLKKFDGSDVRETLAVELLIKILVERLNEIKLLEKLNDEAAKEVELNPPGNPKENGAGKSPEDMKIKANIVFQAAGKHMEQSMICTYISILLGFFVDMKKTFRELVQKKMTQEVVNQAVLVSKGFLSFIELTEGMSKKGIKSLTAMLATLQAIHIDR